MKKLRDIMRSGFLFTVQKQASVSEAVHLMADHNVGIVIVLDHDKLPSCQKTDSHRWLVVSPSGGARVQELFEPTPITSRHR